MNTGPGTLERIRGALASPDFRKLFAIRLVSQSSDGLFQSALVASVVFLSPEQQDTATGFLKATLVIALPYSILGPFVGVFIDRWRRRRILLFAPWVKAALVGLVLFDPIDQAIPFFAGALLIMSVNRFFLSTAAAVVPRLVPHEDLLVANSLATVGGTVALLAGVFVGGRVIDVVDATTPVVIAAGVGWLAASWIASRIASSLKPHTKPEDPGLLRHQLRRVRVEFSDGARRLLRSPRAIGPIASITLDQIGQGIVLTLSLVVFRHEFGGGVASFSNLIGAGGAGVLVGILTVGKLEERFSKPRIVAGAFVVGGVVLFAVSFLLRDWTILLASFATGLTFAWKKISVDTMVQEAVPDGYRGRVFSVYDVVYNLARVAAAALAIPMIPRLGVEGSLAIVGIVFLLWPPVIGRWYGRVPELEIRFVAGGRADETPRAIAWGGAEEPVELVRTWREERDGQRRLAFRLALADGTQLDVSRPEPDGPWRLDREDDRLPSDSTGSRIVSRGSHGATMNEQSRRNALIVGAIVLALLSIGAGTLIALSDDDERAGTPTTTPSVTPSVEPSDDPSVPPDPTMPASPEPPGGESPVLEDGHHFVYIAGASRLEDGTSEVEFDLAYFYVGEPAEREAAERDDEVLNGYYIVNENDRLRTLPLAEDVEVAYIPVDACCDLQPGNVDAWLEAVLETNQTDYGGADVPWWFTVDGGEITRIEQQYLP